MLASKTISSIAFLLYRFDFSEEALDGLLDLLPLSPIMDNELLLSFPLVTRPTP